MICKTANSFASFFVILSSHRIRAISGEVVSFPLGEKVHEDVDKSLYTRKNDNSPSDQTLAEKFRNRKRTTSDNICLEPTDRYRTCYQRAADPSNNLRKDEIQRGEYNRGAKRYEKGKNYRIEPYSPPYVEEDEELMTTTFHLELNQDSTQLTCDEKVVMEEVVLEYLRANVGNEDTFLPICAVVEEWKGYDEIVPDGSGDTAVTTACQMDVTYVIKKEYKDEIDGPSHRRLEAEEDLPGFDGISGNIIKYNSQTRQLQKRCSILWRPLCCSGHAINGQSNSKTCLENGCSRRKCPPKRKKKKKNSSTKIRTYGWDGDHRKLETYTDLPKKLYKKDFNKILNDYTNFKPVRTRAIVGATDTLEVASCSVNRYLEDVYGIPFSCDLYEVDNCKKNEDIIFGRNENVCQSTSIRNSPTLFPTYFGT
ncbi:hypothetical protein ACHAXS_008960 [Conticribra weissflogii]